MTSTSGDSWSIPALRAHFDQRFTDAQKHLDEIIERIDERHRTFEVQVEEAKKAANEWRGALQDRERNTVSRSEWEGKNKALEEKFDQSTKSTNALLAALSAEMRQQFRDSDAKSTAEFEKLRSTNVAHEAERVGARSSLTDARVWSLAALSALSIIFGIVMAIIAASR